MEKISWTDHVRNEEVLLRGNEQRNILHEISKRKANWIGHPVASYVFFLVFLPLHLPLYLSFDNVF